MKQGTKTTQLNGMVVLLLFGVLSVCVLGVLLMGAESYRELTERDRADHERRTAVQYIATRLHHADRAGAVSLRDFDGESALVLKETIDGSVYETIVYCYDGYLCELFVPEDGGFTPEDGTQLMRIGALEFQEDNGRIAFRLTGADGTTQELQLLVRSERGSRNEE
ncbi:MAG: DUF4860 domain-containing protein [Firmicutes bacterium]|nr:DUF4860 domain-containing protein [Bacillota bacterium]